MSTPLTAGGIGFLRHRAGDRIKARYEVLDHLGGGNFGSVYRVRDAAVGNVLACKELHVLNDPATRHDERAAALDLFKREALNLATLRHPHIPAAYFEQEEGLWQVCPRCGLDFEDAAFCPAHGAPLLCVESRHYLMMDYVDGPTLEEMAVEYFERHGRPLPEEQCLEWMAQIGSALRGLHIVGIVHRDIKPDNIKIRTTDSAAILLDFGLTKKVEEAGGYGTARISGTGRFGTPGYAPPNAAEQQHPERRSDIYALGMTLFRLVSNRDPQDEEQLREMMSQPPRSFNAALSPEVERIIGLATASDPARRYQSIDDFLADLNDLRPGSTSTQYAPPFTFSDGARARSALELARLVEAHPDESLPYLFNGMFAGWLRQNGFAAPAQMAENVVKEYAAQPPRALEMFRRALYPAGAAEALPRLEIEPPALSFGTIDSGGKSTLRLRIRNRGPGLAWGKVLVEEPPVNGASTASARSEKALPGLRFRSEWEGNDVTLDVTLDTGQVGGGAYSGALLVRADTAAPKVGTAKIAAPNTAAKGTTANGTGGATAKGAKDTAANDTKASTAAADGAAHGATARVPVDYTVRPLQLRAEPAELDFGTVLVGKRATRTLKIGRVAPAASGSASGGAQNGSGEGRPRGTIYAGASLGGLVAPERFAGEEPFEISADGAMPDAVAKTYEGALHLDTNGGRLRVPVRYAFALPPGRWLTLIGGASLVGGLVGALLRLLYFVVNPDFTLRWLSSAGGIVPLDIASLRAPVALGGLAGLCYGIWWTARTWDRRNTRVPTFQALGQSLTLCTLLGVALCWPVLWALHWGVWVFGDWLLHPLALAAAPPGSPGRDNAPLAWAVVGALIGALWGLGRALAAVGKPWARYALLAALLAAFLSTLINAMLA